jgi:hypothetical protein
MVAEGMEGPNYRSLAIFCMAGVLGFEPRDGGTKNRCLTTWLYPNSAGTMSIH